MLLYSKHQPLLSNLLSWSHASAATAEAALYTQEEIVNLGMMHRLVGVSQHVFAHTQLPLEFMSLEEKMNALNAFNVVPA
jgi:hypothetical protein